MLDAAEDRHKVISPTRSKQLHQKNLRRKRRRLTELKAKNADISGLNSTGTGSIASPMYKKNKADDSKLTEKPSADSEATSKSPENKDCIIM